MSAIDLFINGVKVPRGPLAGSLVVSQRLGQRQTADFAMDIGVKAGESVPVPAQGKTVEIKEAGTSIFAGIIASSKVTEVRANAPGAPFFKRYNIACLDWSWILDRRVSGEYTFTGERASTIIRYLIENTVYLKNPDPFGFSDGIKIDSIPNGVGALITKLELKFPTVAQALDQIVAQSPGWRWRLAADRQLYFEETDLNPAGADWVIDTNNKPVAMNSLTLDINRDRYANKIIGRLSKYETEEQTETFNGSHPSQPVNGTRREWQLVYGVSRTPTVTVNGAVQSVGIRGVDSAAFWLWEAESKIIEKNPILSPPAAGQTVAFTYVGITQENVYAQDNAEIAARQIEEGTSGIYERIIDINTVVANADAQAVADAELAKAKQQGKVLKCRTVWRTSADDTFKPKPGDTIRLTRAAFPDTTFLVTEATLTDQGDKDHHFIRTFTAESGARALNAVEFFSGSAGPGAIGLTPQTGDEGAPPAENIAAVSATPIYDKDRWGVQGTISFGSNRASIKYCELVIDGPYTAGGSEIIGQTRQQAFTTFVPPASGNFLYQSDIGWLRAGSQQRYRVIVRSYNPDEIFTAAPIVSPLMVVDPVNLTSQASSFGAFVFYSTTADGVETWGIQAQWVQANDPDCSFTRIYIEVWNGSAYKERQIYTETAAGGTDNGFFQFSPGEIIDITYQTSTPVRVTFVTFTKDGVERPGAPSVTVTVTPGGGALEGQRLKTSSVPDAKIISLTANKITAGTITASVLMTAPQLIITSGLVTVNIDGSNYVRVQDFGFSRFSRMTGTGFRVESTSNPSNFGQLSAGQLLLGDNSANTMNLGTLNLTFSSNFAVISVGNNPVVGARRTGFGFVSGSAYTGAWDSGTIDHATLARVVQAIYQALHAGHGGHGLISF